MTHWTLDDIDWQAFDASKISPELIRVIKAAALVERNGSDYGEYLCNVFADDAKFKDHARTWAVEEEQHGAALGRWAQLADPDFDFDQAFADFTEAYQIPLDVTESVRGSRTGELIARCIVETGTSSFYSALRDAIEEPVLRQICKKIAADEFRHYKLFFTNMQRYQGFERLALHRRIWVALTRFKEADDEELGTAYQVGNRLPLDVDPTSFVDEYMGHAFGYYQERHARRVGHMVSQAIGFNPDGIVGRQFQKILWWTIERRGRDMRPVLTGQA